MRIKRLALERFRCFEGADLHFDSDVVLMYGRNGLGKTAVFDALELALLGSCGRIRAQGPDEPFSRVQSSTPGRVRVDFNDSAATYIQVEQLRKGTAIIDSSGGWQHHRDFVYEVLMRPEYAPPRRELEAAADLFRSTHLLSQESIRRFVEGDPANRYAILSALAGSNVLHRCVERSREAHRELRKRRERFLSEHAEQVAIKDRLQTQAQEMRQQLDRAALEVRGYDATWAEVARALVDTEEQHADAGSATPDAAAVVDALVSKYEAWQHRLGEETEQLMEVAKLAGDAERMASEMQTLAVGLEARRNEIRSERQRAEEARQRWSQVAMALRELETTATEKRHERDSLSHALTCRNELAAIEGQRGVAELELRARTEERDRCGVDMRAVDGRVNEANAAHSRANDEVTRCSVVTEELRGVLDALATHQANAEGIDAVASEQERVAATVRAVQTQRDALAATLADVRQKKVAVAADLAERREGVQWLSAVVAQLRERIDSAVCPLCGHDHETRDRLLTAIEAMHTGIPEALTNAERQLSALQTSEARVAAELEAEERRLASLHVDGIQLEGNAVRLRTMNEAIAKRAGAVGVTTKPADVLAALERADTAHLRARQDQANISAEIGKLLENLRRAEVLYSAAGRAVEDAKARVDDLAERDTAVRTRSQSLPEWVQALDGKLISSRMSELETTLRMLGNRLVETQGQMAQCTATVAGADESIASLSAAIEAGEAQIGALERGLRANDEARGEIPPGKAGVDAAIGQAQARSEKRARVRRCAELLTRYRDTQRFAALKGVSSQVEGELAAASAVLQRLTDQVNRANRAFTDVGTWVRPIESALDEHVGEALTQHDREIRRLFKAMLPYPFLLEGVELGLADRAVTMAVKYRRQQRPAGEPTNYLSTAQANALALALFLSFSASQNWSPLDVVLMDDPVQHMDDLNALAFLDVLRSVVTLEPRKRQVVISTCVPDLYIQMMRKFGTLNELGVSLTAISLFRGADGRPRVSYDVGGPDNLSLWAAHAGETRTRGSGGGKSQ